jgi:predicted CXXCH cytochrome family protein
MDRKKNWEGKMKTNKKWYQYGVLVSMGALMLAAPASAKVQGQCAICHTMHNSQDGAPMALDAAGVAQEAPNEVLLLQGCVACHTGTNTDGSTETNVIPYVSDTTEPNYGVDGTTGDTLAGGTFYWVATQTAPGGPELTADSTGHNVATDGMATPDGVLLDMPPGATVGLSAQLRCAGVNGCHGDTTATSDFAAISGSHHADDVEIDGSTTAKSFRFLLGIVGLEDSDWEFQPTATTHNQYKGVDRGSDTENDPTTISSLCARCHNDYHNGAGNVGGTNPTTGAFGSPWVRHPTDFDMSNTAITTDYRNYGGEGINEYQVSAPVASNTIGEFPQSNVFVTADDAIVTCISCHRAHGTKYADLLRWDYSSVAAGVSGTGACFECHTTK